MSEPREDPPSHPRPSGHRPFSPLRLGLTTAIVAGTLSLMVVGLLFPMVGRGQALDRRLICGSNLKGVATASRIYANDVGLAVTASIESLVEQGYMSSERTICPYSGLSTSNYVMAPVSRTGPVDNRTIVAFEPKSNHGGGGNVVYADGHAAFATGDEYDRLVAEATARVQR